MRNLFLVAAVKILQALICISLMPAWCNAEDLSNAMANSPQPKISLIAIDPGFGGDKTGPSGCDGKVLGKDINLQIAKKVEDRIEKELGISVMLTRDSDVDISLEERCASANNKNADIFISIHANASDISDAAGVETYFLNMASDSDSIKTAAGQNAKTGANSTDLEAVLTELLQGAKTSASALLANTVQDQLHQRLKTSNRSIKNRGAKQAPFFVLLNTQMPAIVVTPGFITNHEECNLLGAEAYQEDISTGIVEGIRAFIQAKNTYAHKWRHERGQ